MRFARLEHAGKRRFNMAYMRHTGKWHEVFQELTLDECLDQIRDEGIFQS